MNNAARMNPLIGKMHPRCPVEVSEGESEYLKQ